MHFDIHPDQIVRPYLNGVKLAEPTGNSTVFPNIQSLFAMPCMVYFVRFDAHYVDANHVTRLTNIPGNQGYYSEKDLQDRAFSTIFKNASIELYSYQNNNVLH